MKTSLVSLMKQSARSRPVRHQMRSHPAVAARAVWLIRRLQQEPDETQFGRQARYCYSVWLRHLSRLQACGLTTHPRSIVEIGPGDTIGVGVAALLSGSESLVALDSHRYLSVSATIQLLPELVGLFATRAAIPDQAELPEVEPYLPSYSFPHSTIPSELLSASLTPERVASIRRSILNLDERGPDTEWSMGEDEPQGETSGERVPAIAYHAGWLPEVVPPESTDLIVSQAVMEHMEDIHSAYSSFASWLSPGGHISHQIDFRCHGTSFEWNGHWTYDHETWGVVANRKVFRWINREPLSAHVAAAEAAGLDVQLVQVVENSEGAPKSSFAAPFAEMADSDAVCQGALLIAQRPIR